MPSQQLTELVALGLFQLATEVVGGHPVRLVDDHEVPVGVLKLALQFVGTGKLVHPRDELVMPGEDIAIGLCVR